MVFDFKTRGGGVKWRLISDCRELNQWFTLQPFKLVQIPQILPNSKKGVREQKWILDSFFLVPIHSE
jgi:hypothetical protein